MNSKELAEKVLAGDLGNEKELYKTHRAAKSQLNDMWLSFWNGWLAVVGLLYVFDGESELETVLGFVFIAWSITSQISRTRLWRELRNRSKPSD